MDNEGKPDPNAKVPFADEARYFVEIRLLQRDVEIILESVNNNNFVGSILHPKGNIAEALLKEGFARCVDWSMSFMKSGKSYMFVYFYVPTCTHARTHVRVHKKHGLLRKFI